MKPVFCLLLIIGMVLLIYGSIDDSEIGLLDRGAAYFVPMARSVPGFNADINRMDARRVLCPYLVGLMPVEPKAGFLILRTLLVVGIVVLLYKWLRIKATVLASLLAVFLFMSLTEVIGEVVWNYYQCKDLAVILTTVLAVYALDKKNWGLYALTVGVGILNSECGYVLVVMGLVSVRKGNVLFLPVAIRVHITRMQIPHRPDFEM